jgi:melibiose permease
MRDVKTKGSGIVPNSELFGYSAGLAGQNMTYNYITNWLRYFCINILHIDELKVGRIFFISYFWDAVNDPVIGAIVDRRRHKNGEKLRPYLIQLPPIIGALSAIIFLKVNFGENGNLLYILLIYLVWDFFYSVQDVALWGMVALSSPLSQERSKVAQWATIGAGLGGVFVGAFQTLRSMLTNKYGFDDFQVFIIFALIFGLGGEIISMWSHMLHESVKSEKPTDSIIKSITILKYNKTLLIISLARLLQSVSPFVQQSYFFENLVSYQLGNSIINGQNAEVLFGIFSGIPGVFAVFFATKIAKKIGGMKKILILSQIMAITLRIAAYFVGYQSIPRMIVVAFFISLANIPGMMMDIAHRSLTSDSIDYVEWKTGLRTEGISFSVQNFISKMKSGVSSLIEGIILDKLKYDSVARALHLKQNPTFLKWQWPIFIVGPVVGAVLYLVTIFFVEDNNEKRDYIENELRKRHREINEAKAEVNA